MDIMTKVRVLWEKVAGITADVSAVDAKATATAATLAGILPRIPADYSETETATGQKWIDGKEIFMKVLIGKIPTLETTSNVSVQFGGNLNLIRYNYYFKTSSSTFSNRFGANWSNSSIIFSSVVSSFSEGDYFVTIYYTKPTSTRDDVTNADKGTGEDPEPETKKRKTTKKEDK